MNVSIREYGFGIFCLNAALACLKPPEPAVAAPVAEPSVAAPAATVASTSAPAAPPPPPPLDDPNSCFELNPEIEEARKSALEDSGAIAAEIQRRVIERSDQLQSCRAALQGTEEVDAIVEVGADGATRAKVAGTSADDCAVLSCIRERLTGIQIVGPKAGMSHAFRWLLAVDPTGPVRFQPSDPTAKWFGKSPKGSATCLDSSESSKISGRLPPEIIRRIVRANYGAFRKCYEDGLARHNDLTGKVTVRFVIERDGKVSNAAVSDTTLPDCAVVHCIRDGFSKLEFPRPEGGIVTVQYPIMLQPG